MSKIKDINDLPSKDVTNVAFLCLGGNMGNRLENILQATRRITEKCGNIVKASGIYETEAWGHQSEYKYLNQVLEIQTSLSAPELLKKLLLIEKQTGRIRNGKGYSNRTMDIDLLFFNNEIISQKNLEVPHPRLHLRKFVLVPLNQCWKNKMHPVLHQKVSQLLKNCQDPLQVKLFRQNQSPIFISIEGNIGSGKTTLAKALSEKLKAQLICEEFEETPLLSLFYKEAGQHAFLLEYSFLISRFSQLSQISGNGSDVFISDYSFYKSLWFAKANLSKKEFSKFKKHFNLLLKHLPAPLLIVYLTTSTNNLKKNIAERGRPFEKNISAGYLQKIDKACKKGIKTLDSQKILEINIPRYYPQLEKELMIKIENHLKESFGKQG